MTMLDFEGTKEELADHAVVPEFAAIKAGGQRRRIRRRLAGVVAAVAIVALGVAVLPLANGHRTQLAPATGQDVPDAVAGQIAGAQVTAVGTVVQFQLVLTSKLQLAVVRTAAKRPALARTVDGGVSWQAWELPPDVSVDKDNFLTIKGVDGYVALMAFSRTVVELGPYVSRDSGKTWARIHGTVAGGTLNNGSSGTQGTVVVAATTVNSVPKDWFFQSFCASQFSCKLYAVDPVHFAWHQLEHQPAVTDAVEDAKGRLWAANRTLVPGQGDKPSCSLSASTDRGVTWVTHPVPATEGCTGAPSVGADGKAYAIVATAGATDKTPGVLVSSDGGIRWQRQALGMNLTDLFVLPDGTMIGHPVLGSDEPGDSLVSSKDGGKTFSPIPNTAHAGTLTRTVGGSYTTTVAAGGRLSDLVSDDGVHWVPAATVPAK